MIEDVKARQSRLLDALYPIVYLDYIHAKVRDNGAVRIVKGISIAYALLFLGFSFHTLYAAE